MTGPAVVSIARIDPELARRSWGRVQRLVAGDGLGNAENLQCFIAVFGHGDPNAENLPETVERVRRVLAAGTPDRLRPHIAVQAALSSEPSADTPGTLYVNWLFEPGVPNELVEDIYMHTLPLAIFAAIQGAPKARVTWPHDDEIAARVVTAAAPLSPVERAEERLDVPRVPGFEPVQDSTKTSRNPVFVGKTKGLCGSERVRKWLAEHETAGSTAGSGQPDRRSRSRVPAVVRPSPAFPSVALRAYPCAITRVRLLPVDSRRSRGIPCSAGERYERRRWSITCLFPLG